MTVRELIALIGAKAAAGEENMDREISGGYVCDLLSLALAHGTPGMIWVTVQTHMNVVAAAVLIGAAAVVVPEGRRFPSDVIAKAQEEGIVLLESDHTAYALCGMMFSAGVKAVAR